MARIKVSFGPFVSDLVIPRASYIAEKDDTIHKEIDEKLDRDSHNLSLLKKIEDKGMLTEASQNLMTSIRGEGEDHMRSTIPSVTNKKKDLFNFQS